MFNSLEKKLEKTYQNQKDLDEILQLIKNQNKLMI